MVAGRSLLLLAAGVVAATLLAVNMPAGSGMELLPQFILWTALMLAVVLAVWRDGTGRPIADLLLHFKPVDLLIGLLFGIGLRFIAVVVELLSTGQQGFVLPSLPLFNGQLPTLFWFTGIVAPLIIAPLLEEVFFRGVLQRSVTKAVTTILGVKHVPAAAAAIIVSSIAFAGLHMIATPSLTMGLITLLIGLACGVLAELTGRLGPAICAHFAFNSIAVLMTLIGTH